MIPKIYDTKRVARILGEDGEPKNIKIDPQQQQAKTEQQGENGEIQSIYNLGVGKYDVVVDTGPSYATKRQEAAESMMQFVQADPAILQIAGDLIVKNMDWPGADEIAKRMKIMLPPQIGQADKGEEGGQQVDPQIEQQMNQMADQMQHMSEELQAAKAGDKEREEANDIKRFEAQTKRMEVEAKIAAEQMGMIHQMAVADLAHTMQQPNTGETEGNEPEAESQHPAAMPQPTAQSGAIEE
jgi:hypothetical protein